jgi:hypothetical protein
MADLVFDLETIGVAWADLDAPTRDYLTARWERRELALETDEERGARGALELGLAQIVAAGFWNPQTQRGQASILVPHDAENTMTADGPIISYANEADLLASVWPLLARHRLVSFNGRIYDGPVLTLRSAELGVPVTRNLVPYRYDLAEHCDLSDVLLFQGALRYGYTLDYWCRRFGIEGKDDVHGGDVARLYAAGEYMTIGRYALDDAKRTGALYVALRDAGVLAQFKNGPKAVERREEAAA